MLANNHALKNNFLRTLQSQSDNYEDKRRLLNVEANLEGMHPKALSDLSSYFNLLQNQKSGNQAMLKPQGKRFIVYSTVLWSSLSSQDY